MKRSRHPSTGLHNNSLNRNKYTTQFFAEIDAKVEAHFEQIMNLLILLQFIIPFWMRNCLRILKGIHLDMRIWKLNLGKITPGVAKPRISTI
jgi:hypothetical protein